jgi:hypothetical protein
MHLISQSDPELSKTLDAQRIRDILSHLGAQSRFEHSGGNVWTLFTLIPTASLGPYHEDGTAVEEAVTVHNQGTGQYVACEKVIDVLGALFPEAGR